MIVEKDSSPVGNKYDLVGITGTWAFYVPVPFWIIVFYFDFLGKLFPAYSARESANNMFMASALTCILAGAVAYVCHYIIYEQFEKGRYQSTGLLRKEPSLNLFLFEYRGKKSYGKLIVATICWVSSLICFAASTSIFFGLIVVFKYLPTYLTHHT